MKISMAIGAGASLDPKRLTQHVTDLEAAGVDMIWGGEIYGFDLVSTLAYVAAKTERIQLMTGILPIYSRSPAIIAQTAMTIDTLSEGRFILGLGTSGPQVIEGWHGVPFSKPMGRTRDVIEICRKVWSGDKVVHDGSAVSLPYDGGTGLGKPLKLMAKPHRRATPPVSRYRPDSRRRSGPALADHHTGTPATSRSDRVRSRLPRPPAPQYACPRENEGSEASCPVLRLLPETARERSGARHRLGCRRCHQCRSPRVLATRPRP